MGLLWNELDQSQAFKELQKIGKTTPDPRGIGAKQIEEQSIPLGGDLSFCYATSLIREGEFDLLQQLSNEQQLTEKYNRLLSGDVMNTGEKRRVLHHLTRGQQADPVSSNGEDLRSFYEEQRQRFGAFAEAVHSGSLTGFTGKKFKTVIQIGIGGSDLGPRALYLALRNLYPSRLQAFFISNVDPDDAEDLLSRIDVETSLFILVSKSGTTQETLTNYQLVKERIRALKGKDFDTRKHFIAVTSKTSPLANSSDMREAFFIDDNIGGRYSSTSSVGGVVLSLAFGAEIFARILEGAADADALARNPDIRKNAPLMDALIGVFYRNIKQWPVTAILPYSQALSRFPAHLQQLDMESNGKSVNRFGQSISYPTGPVVFGEPGTNGQHSFYQLLHQGTDIIPLQFIGFLQSQMDKGEGTRESQKKLNANLAAQIIAFAHGRPSPEGNKSFAGGRPSSLITGERLDAKTLGALLAHYENKVMFQGFCWNINSFDQEGVQLGKILTEDILAQRSDDELLKGYSRLLGLSG